MTVRTPQVVVTIEPATVNKETAAQMLGVGETTLMQLVSDGKLNARKLNSRTVFTVEDIREFAQSLPSWEPGG